MNTTYRPRVGSLPSRVIDWLQRNPDEELSRADIAQKFNIAQTSVQPSLSDAVKAGVLVWAQGEDTEWVYRLGANSPASPFRGLAGGSSAAQEDAPEPTLEVLRALKVDDSVPIKKPKIDHDSRWEPLFTKLHKPGLSIQIPVAWKRSLALAAARRNKAANGASAGATFKVGNDHDTPHARIWRIS